MGHNENPQFWRKKCEYSKSELADMKECFDDLRKENEMDEDQEWYLRKRIEDESNDDDPQHMEFLKNLSVNGNSYKLAIYKNKVFSHYIKYEEPEEEEDEDHEWYPRNHIEDEPNDDDPQYMAFLKNLSVNGKSYKLAIYKNNVFSHYRKYEEDEESDSCSSDSDSDIQILENFNHKQPAPAKLKDEVICILREPYSSKEYAELSECFEKKKPICRLLPLRGRSISSALKKDGRSFLEQAPALLQRKLEAAKKEGQRPKVLNLMRMFQFWLKNLPNEDIFNPWADEECLKVQPNEDIFNP